jgi:hypothetical protein
VKGGHCLVAWTSVTKPKEMGGLGVGFKGQVEMALENQSKQAFGLPAPSVEFGIGRSPLHGGCC